LRAKFFDDFLPFAQFKVGTLYDPLLELRVLCADACTGQPAISVRASSLALYVRLSVSTNTLPFRWRLTDFSVPKAACRALLSTNGEIIDKGLLTSDDEIITNFGKLVCKNTITVVRISVRCFPSFASSVFVGFAMFGSIHGCKKIRPTDPPPTTEPKWEVAPAGQSPIPRCKMSSK